MLKGARLGVAASIAQRYNARMQKLIERMARETKRTLIAVFRETFLDGVVMDASPSAQAQIALNALSRKWESMFGDISKKAADEMIGSVERNSAATLKMSLKDIAQGITLDTSVLTGELHEVINASVKANVALIRRVPSKYFDQIQGDVMRSIQTGRGLADLIPALEKQHATIRNWAKNVALDQTRKVYSDINSGRMQALGFDEYEWLHSGGSNHPRKYHQEVLNGKICRLSEPPIIQVSPEVRGKPGDLPYCRCSMRPIFRFTKDEENAA